MAAVLDLGWQAYVAMAASCAIMLLLPLAFKWLMKILFQKEISYFVSFLIVLAICIVWGAAMSYFDHRDRGLHFRPGTRLHRPPRGSPRSPRPLKIESAQLPGHIDDLADKIKTGHAAALHRLR